MPSDDLDTAAIAPEEARLKGQSMGIDSTTLEATAVMKSILRKDMDEDCNDYLTRLPVDKGFGSAAAGSFPGT